MMTVLGALMDCAFFFELSDDSAVDPDAAVQQLEQIQASLLELGHSERDAVRNQLAVLAKQQSNQDRKAVVQGFLDALDEE